jgi:hypothetical protein
MQNWFNPATGKMEGVIPPADNARAESLVHYVVDKCLSELVNIDA